MAATLTGTPPAGRAARRAPGAPPRGTRGMARRHGLSTPETLRALLASLVLLSLAWGAFGGWVATVHSSAAQSLVSVDEPLSLDARQMYQAIADADATITAAYLASSQPLLAPLQRYSRDIETAATDLSRLRSGGESTAAGSALAALSGGLTLIAAVALAVVTGFVLYRVQRWLTRRTNRMLSPGSSLPRCC